MQMQPNVMDSLCKQGYVYGDEVFGQDSLANRTLSVGWELNDPEFGAESFVSEKGSDSFVQGIHSRENCCNRGGIEGTSTLGVPNALSVDDELSTKFPNPFSESNCQASTLINLNLGGLESRPCSKSSVVSSDESSAPIKRSRSAGLNSQTFFCQVHECNKDLSSSKDYHKKHRVCDSHSKTAKVIVNGIEQRFCQQCSRFHLLDEFDERKRSCRRRLAGHNERRRKPHLGNQCGRNRRFQSYNAPPATGNLHHRNHLPDISFGKQYPCVHENQANYLLGSVINDTGDNHLHGIPGLQCSCGSYSFTTSGNQDSNVFYTGPDFNGFPITNSAFSLLSSQSLNSPSYSTGIHMAQTSSITGNHAHCSESQVSDTRLKAFPIASVNGVSHKLAACGLNPEMSDLHLIQIPEDKLPLNLEVQNSWKVLDTIQMEYLGKMGK